MMSSGGVGYKSFAFGLYLWEIPGIRNLGKFVRAGLEERYSLTILPLPSLDESGLRSERN
jgi:hypothetical protein